MFVATLAKKLPRVHSYIPCHPFEP